MKMRKLLLGMAACSTALLTQGALVGEWTFDEGAGTTVANTAATGNTYDGTVVGTPAFVPGHDGTGFALNFDGTNGNYVTLPSGFLASVSNEISIAFWAYGNSNQPQPQIAFQGQVGTSDRELQSHLPWSNGAVYWDAADRMNFGASATLYKENWTWWVMTKNIDDNGSMKVYANGQLVGSATGKNNAINGSGISRFAIGGDNNGGSTYHGIIDDFQIYDHELTLSEIAIGYDPNIIAPVIDQSAGVGESPFEVVFVGTNSVAGNGVSQYLWNFGGSTNMTIDATGGVVTNSFVSEGVHTITLWVVDGIGATNSATTSVRVDSPFWSTNLVGTMQYTRENLVSSNYPTASATDLLQTAFLTNTLFSQNADLTNNWSILVDGSVGTSDKDAAGAAISPSGFTRMYAGDWFEVEFDLTGAPLGYDLNQVRSIFGWNIAAGGRSNQGYDLIVTYVDGSSETLMGWQYWNPNVPTTYWTGVTLDNSGGTGFISGVKKVKFQITQNAVPGGWVLLRELDVFGTPTQITEAPVITYGGTASSNGVVNGLILSWGSVGGATYSVQSADNLIAPSWVSLPDYTSVLATPPMNTYTAAVNSAAAEFFRVIIE